MVGIAVPEVEENERLYSLGLDAQDASLGQYLRAWWEEPTTTGDAARYVTRSGHRRRIEPTFPDSLTGDPAPSPFYDPYDRMSDTDADEQFGIPGHLSFAGKGPQSRAVAQELWDLKRAELARDDIYSRFKGGVGAQALGFGVGLLSQALDPINAASAFLPVVGEARAALWAERLGVVGSRLGRGAVEGFAGGVALEPISLAFAADEQRNYTVADSVFNVTFGTIIGAGLHAGGGAIADRFAPERPAGATVATPVEPPTAATGAPDPVPVAVRRAIGATPELNEAALRGSVAALIEDRPVAVSRLYDAAENPPARVGDPDVIRIGDSARVGGRNLEVVETFGRNGPVVVRDPDAAAQGVESLRAYGSPREFTRATGLRLAQDDLRESARALANAPESLSEYVRRTGGVSLEDARDYGLLGREESPIGKLSGLARRDGRSLDRIREDVSQDAVGYIKADADLNDLAEAISRDLRGRTTEERVYSVNDADAVRTRAEYEGRFARASRLAELGTDEVEGIRADAVEALAEAARGYDPVIETMNGLRGESFDPFDLETSAVLAADIKSRARGESRFSEAKAALQQAQSDLEQMRRSGAVPADELAAYETFVRDADSQARDMQNAYRAGAACMSRNLP